MGAPHPGPGVMVAATPSSQRPDTTATPLADRRPSRTFIGRVIGGGTSGIDEAITEQDQQARGLFTTPARWRVQWITGGVCARSVAPSQVMHGLSCVLCGTR